MTLRPYQKDACNFIVDWFDRTDDPALAVLPTGAGKTRIFSAISKYFVLRDPVASIVVLAHRHTLVKQNAESLRGIVPAPVGIWCGSLNLKQAEQITVATIQSMDDFPITPDLVIVDEAHNIPHGEEGRYHELLAKMPPHAKLLGVTATPYRLGGGEIVGPDHLFPGMTFRVDMVELINDGYLVRPRLAKGTEDTLINVEGLRVTGGDYNQKDLEERVANLDLIQRQVFNALPRLAGRNKVIWFCVDIAHAEAVAAHLPDAVVLHSKMTTHQRDVATQGFHMGLFRHLVNVSVATEGYDEPAIDAVVLLRPTQSPVFYVQAVGRGLRLSDPTIGHLPAREDRLSAIAASGKPDCLVLDYARVVENLGPVNAPVIKVKKSGKSDAKADPPLKVCDGCMEYVPVHVVACPECGFEFPKKADEAPLNLTRDGGHARILDTGEPYELMVTNSWADEYTSMNSGRRCLLITYKHGLLSSTPEYLTFDSPFPLKKAREALAELGMSNVHEINTVDDAIARMGEMEIPASIFIKKDGKYTRVVRRVLHAASGVTGA
jgi:DNA repair protein RadD